MGYTRAIPLVDADNLNREAPRRATAEASRIGLKAGEWPDTIAIKGGRSKGKFYLYKQDYLMDGDQIVLGVMYRNKQLDLELFIFND